MSTQIPYTPRSSYEQDRYQQFVDDLTLMGVVNCVGGWKASSFSNREYVLAREAVMARKPGGLEEIEALAGLRKGGDQVLEVLAHAVSVAARGTPHALAWAKGVNKICPWAADSLGGDLRWLREVTELPGAAQRMTGRAWTFFWKSMAERWVMKGLVARRGDVFVGDTREVLALSIVARMGGDRLKWDHHVARIIETRLSETTAWPDDSEQRKTIEWFQAKCRNQLLGHTAVLRGANGRASSKRSL